MTHFDKDRAKLYMNNHEGNGREVTLVQLLNLAFHLVIVLLMMKIKIFSNISSFVTELTESYGQ